MDNPIQTQNSQGTWQNQELEQLSMALTLAYKTQTTYKEPLDLEDRVAGWKFVLEEDWTVMQVLYALHKFMKENKVMPVPADINALLKPEPPKVTQAEYIQACKEHERNNFTAFSAEYMVIEQYKKENDEAREDYSIECDKIKEICSNSVKRLEN